MRKAKLDGLHAAAIAAVASLITYVPVYAIIFGTGLFNAPWRDIALQAFVQGLLTAVISLMLYGRAVSILGASNGSAFAALAQLRRFEHLGGCKYLRSLGPTPEGRHYSGIGGTGPAVILGAVERAAPV